jgi:hypothetical protein
MHTSAARYRVSAVESPTFEDAIKIILAARAAAAEESRAPLSGAGWRRPE